VDPGKRVVCEDEQQTRLLPAGTSTSPSARRINFQKLKFGKGFEDLDPSIFTHPVMKNNHALAHAGTRT